MPNDLLLDDGLDLMFADGDLVIGEATRQHQVLLLLTSPGELREFPMRGVGLQHWLLDDAAKGDVTRRIKQEFEADGMTVQRIRYNGDNVTTEASYE